MDKQVEKLENCLKAMKKCLAIPTAENCICFSDAFKVMKLEADELSKKNELFRDAKARKAFVLLKKEIEDIQGRISKGNKECLGCNPCVASCAFQAYPNKLNELYLDNEL